ncbi:MAG: hypothetical protein KY468_03500 [Armatimonadetes bacterium]|nr:hypothetical protein [Armatimonadota bacterium]
MLADQASRILRLASQSIDPAGRTFRIFYAVEGDWAVIPQKPFLQYDVVRYESARRANNFTLPIGNATIVPGIQPGPNGRGLIQVLFPTVDEGKAVNFNYTYRTRSGTLKTIYGEEQQISSEARQTGGKSWAVGTSQETPKPYIFIELPSDAQVNNMETDFTLNQLRGVSFRAVTVWRDRSRWRQEAITTHLTRASGS